MSRLEEEVRRVICDTLRAQEGDKEVIAVSAKAFVLIETAVSRNKEVATAEYQAVLWRDLLNLVEPDTGIR